MAEYYKAYWESMEASLYSQHEYGAISVEQADPIDR